VSAVAGDKSRVRPFLLTAGALLVAALLTLCTFALGACGTPAIADKAVGSWQETSTAESYQLDITWVRSQWKDSQQYEVDYQPYQVDYQRLGASYAYLKGDNLLIWGENPWSVIWRVTYDQATDQLTASRGQVKITFKRIKG
jgi:hypothetical protein